MNNKGFTIIEMLVVIGVLGMLMTITMVFYGRAGERQITLFREQARVLNAVSRAKFLSIQTFVQRGEKIPCGYGIHFEEPKTFILFRDDSENCATADHKYSEVDSGKCDGECVEKSVLDNAVMFDSLKISDIVFIPPNPVVVITPEEDQAEIIIKTIDDKGRVSIKVNNFGQITTQ